MGHWDLPRVLVVLGVPALFAGFMCVGEASGWHGWGRPYYTTPFSECLTQTFPIFFVVAAAVFAYATRNWGKPQL